MKFKLFAIIMGQFLFFSCGQKSNLTQVEAELVKKIDFNQKLVSEIKGMTKSDIKQLPAIDKETGETLRGQFYDGVYSQCDEDEAIEVVIKLKPKYRKNGYLIFVFEGEDDMKNIAIIKGSDDLDILRYRRTDGINYDLENEDIVKKISEWKSKYGLIVIGCGRDWLHVEFEKLPTNIEDFAKEVYEFCPDSVDQGVGTMEKLEEAIITMKGVWLWWD